GVRLLVDERGARYPLTIDPIAQQAYLKPAAVGTTQAGDNFGISVAVSGDTVVVGALGEDSSTTGVNSTPNESASLSGAAYVFVRSAGTWAQQAYLKPAAVGTTQAGDNFGISVAISGETVIVGAYGEGSSTTGVNSTPNESAGGSGAAYVFVRSAGTWAQQAYLKPGAVGTTQVGDRFGGSVAVSGDTLVVGASNESSNTTGVNSTPNESAPGSGAAYVFVRSAGVWTQQAYLKPAAVGTTQDGDQFGWSVAVSDDTVVVGAYFEDSNTTGVNSTPNESASNAGAAYVFVRNAGVWTQQAYVKPAAVGTTQAGDQFGTSVGVSGNTVVVGAHQEGSDTTGVNSTPNDSLSFSGAAYVFVRSAGAWTQQAYLKPAAVGTTQTGDFFGWSVAVSGDTVVVGANLEDSSTTGVNSTPNESAGDSGAAYVFARNAGVWTQQAYLKPAAVGTTQVGDQFGISVAVSGYTVVVGAYQEDSSTTFVNSTPEDSGGINVNAGAAYVFALPEIAVEQPAGTDLTSGAASIGFGAVGNSTDVKTFTVKNNGNAVLTITSVGVTGGNAGEFAVNTTGMLTTVPANTSSTFTVTFTTAASGIRTTTLRILNDDSNEGTFDITLTGMQLSFTTDTDGDGLSDASEFQMAALGFNWQVSQPALVNTLFSNLNGALPNLNAAGFYTTAQVQALNVGVPLIQRSPTGVFTLTIGVEKSTDLSIFNPFPMNAPGFTTVINGAGKLEFRFTVPDNAAFFRLEAQ
ncbi:MAG: choice-of-anchor D domain-containing protein, partial [Chthoniobacterales bacterium]